ncbi:tRNA synthetases class I (M)-domain-containing protein [Umbelopsis sp. AD052]|nr:tRNA synthetases class I (M)-domain-containing protein [Umbelopsis sp. AD052]
MRAPVVFARVHSLVGCNKAFQRRWQHTKPFYITTPIFYPNAAPHIGHLYSAVIADSIKRYYQLKGETALLLTGTDEHGLKIQQAAAANDMEPIAFCDQISQRFKDLADKANIQYTTFMRTTEARHHKAVAKIWNILEENGYIYKGKHEGWYSISDEAFYTSGQVQEAVDEKTGKKVMVSVETGQPVEWTVEENYKFKLSACQDDLRAWLSSNPTAVVPQNRMREVQSWIDMGLADLSISRPRSRLTWGIQVPNDPDHTIYVWLDALVNYITATGYPWADNQKGIKNGWPADVHIVGKDIVRFHAIYWPAFLMAANLPLPKQIVAHAHWTMNKQKMSKSRGNVVEPMAAMDYFGVDPVRYYLLRDGGLADDGDYSHEAVMVRYKKDLAGQLGNLLARCTAPALIPSGMVPVYNENAVTKDDHVLQDQLKALPDLFCDRFEDHEYGKALQAIFDVLSEANRHFTDNQPWNLIKDPEQKARLNQVLFYSVESCRMAGILLQCVMPEKSDGILNRLGVDIKERTLAQAHFGTGWPTMEQHRQLGISHSPVIFPRIK